MSGQGRIKIVVEEANKASRGSDTVLPEQGGEVTRDIQAGLKLSVQVQVLVLTQIEPSANPIFCDSSAQLDP